MRDDEYLKSVRQNGQVDDNEHAETAITSTLEVLGQRIAEHEGRGCSADEAREHARAVLSTLAGSVSEGEIEDVRSQLPRDYAFLMER